MTNILDQRYEGIECSNVLSDGGGDLMTKEGVRMVIREGSEWS